MLAVLCCVCGYGIVCPSFSMCGPIFIYYRRALRLYGCMRTFMRITLHGGAEKWQKRGENQMGSVSFLSSCKRVLVIFGK